MLIVTVKFKSSLSHEEALAIVEERISEYRSFPGLIQKYYGHEQETGAYTGVFVWESAQALRAFRESELSQSTAAAYQAIEPPRIEIFDVFETLRPVEVAASVS
jgi:heme-degrading monooxygenase HmoA